MEIPGQSYYETNSILFYGNYRQFECRAGFGDKPRVPHYCLICSEFLLAEEIGRAGAE